MYSYASKQSTLGIGQKALRNLLDINFEEHESLSINEDWTLKVNVKYVTLPQGISAILQPLSSSFQRDVLDTRGELEKYLKHCCTLTEGEIISLNKKSCELNDPLEDGSNGPRGTAQGYSFENGIIFKRESKHGGFLEEFRC